MSEPFSIPLEQMRRMVKPTPKGRALDQKAVDEVRALLGKMPRRRDLLPDSLGLDRLLAAHDDRCDHVRLRDLLARPDAEAQAAVRAMLAYDAQLRAMAVSRLNVPEDELDFLLGRPLTAFLLPADLESQGEKTYLASDPPQGERP